MTCTRGACTTIGGLRDMLANLDRSLAVYIDNRPPTALSSYRGYYDDLAIERSDETNDNTELDEPGNSSDLSDIGLGIYRPGSAEVKIKTLATVGDLIAALDLADGATFKGYKGGQYRMDLTSNIWVSEYGDASSLQVDRVELLPGRVDLFTTEVEW